ncbi:MAG: TolC family protein [Bacteroidota bacterium]|nr:TolC family protein [Bacteroidota bacterium]
MDRCYAQVIERLGLKTAIDEAVTHNVSLKAIEYEISAAEGDISTAGLRPNPNLTLIGDILPSNGLGPADKYYGASLSLPFELGGKREARLKYAHLQHDLSELRYEDAIRQTVYAVKASYLDLVTALEKAAVAEENLALFDSLVSLDRIRVAGQEIAEVDLTRTEVEREKISLEAMASQEQSRAVATSLSMLLGRKIQNESILIQPDTTLLSTLTLKADVLLPAMDSLMSIALAQRSDIRALAKAEEASKAQLELQKSLAAIDLTVSLDANRQQGTTFWGASFSAPLPFFDRHQGEIEKAEALSSEAQTQTNAAILQLRAEIASALSDANTKRLSLVKLRDNIIQKSKSVRISVEYSYRRGSTSLIDFLDAIRTENELHQLFVDALEAYAKSLITLDYLIGKDILYAVQ